MRTLRVSAILDAVRARLGDYHPGLATTVVELAKDPEAAISTRTTCAVITTLCAQHERDRDWDLFHVLNRREVRVEEHLTPESVAEALIVFGVFSINARERITLARLSNVRPDTMHEAEISEGMRQALWFYISGAFDVLLGRSNTLGVIMPEQADEHIQRERRRARRLERDSLTIVNQIRIACSMDPVAEVPAGFDAKVLLKAISSVHMADSFLGQLFMSDELDDDDLDDEPPEEILAGSEADLDGVDDADNDEQRADTDDDGATAEQRAATLEPDAEQQADADALTEQVAAGGGPGAEGGQTADAAARIESPPAEDGAAADGEPGDAVATPAEGVDAAQADEPAPPPA